MMMTACQTSPKDCQTTTIETDQIVEKSDVAEAWQPIFISRSDVLTVGTREQIRDNNNAYWCAFEAKRQTDFDTSVCDP